ncbi:MAG: aldehyde dehydrogenase family protein [Pikeienuella sp.]
MINTRHYINGEWVSPGRREIVEALNPATNAAVARVALGSAEDVDLAARAAKAAFESYAATPVAERAALLRRIADGLEARREDMARSITAEMGAPITMARGPQSGTALAHFRFYADLIEQYDFEAELSSARVIREPIGVCGFITPWNWPLHQVALKVAPALAAGCAVVLKPSELSPLSAMLFAEILHEAGAPPGVFNMVFGLGEVAGAALSAHPLVDMVSITGSTRAGIAVAKSAADTIKRVAQELGGKSPNLILPDAGFTRAVPAGVAACFNNCGQSCSSPTRMLVPRDRLDEVIALAREALPALKVGDPEDPETRIGPLISERQWARVQDYIALGETEGARMVAGGVGKPEGLDAGNFVRPTIFADVTPEMRICREEIFGPVLCIQTYADIDEAVALANDTDYGLVAHLQGSDPALIRAAARRLRAGRVIVNGAAIGTDVPFGGYKQSGNGREYGVHGLEEFFEIKAVVGY